ncbi:MAG: nuclear transport factor 2 family protein [Bacteroidia bacterium]|jgi:ketosteroid isomerase-like protein|nr:nuclear transport factor 2 family protein [Bacteroidia bacterium]
MHVSLNAQELTKVLDLMKAQELAWNAGDLEGFMTPYLNSDSLLFVGGSGITYGWNSTLNRYKKAYPDKASMGELKFTILKTEQLSPDYIYVLGKWSLKKEKPASGHFTLIWKKIKGEWKITSDHSS